MVEVRDAPRMPNVLLVYSQSALKPQVLLSVTERFAWKASKCTDKRLWVSAQWQLGTSMSLFAVWSLGLCSEISTLSSLVLIVSCWKRYATRCIRRRKRPRVRVNNRSDSWPSQRSLLSWPESHPVLFLRLERDPKLEKFDHNVAEFREEDLVILGVAFHVLLEFLVFDECHIGW